MDSQTSGACPECGQPLRDDHACGQDASATPDVPWTSGNFEDTGRIAIPEALRNTGLFRAAWAPSAPEAAPQTLSNIFERVEDAPAPERAPLRVIDPSPVTEPEATATPVAPTEESPVNDKTPDAEHDPFAGDAPVAPQQPEEPTDPWAGLDLTITEPVEQHTDENPWAHLEPAADEGADEVAVAEAADEADADEASADDVPTGETAVITDELLTDDEPAADVDPFDLYGDQPAEVAPVADEAEPSDVEPEADTDPALEAVEVPAEDEVVEEWDDQELAEDEWADEPVDEEPADGWSNEAADEAPISAIAATEAAAIAAGHTAPALDETVAIDLNGEFDAVPTDFEEVPEPEQSAYDLYGDSLYAPEDDAPEAVAAPAPLEPDPFSTGLSAAGISSASLPASVPFAPQTDEDGQPVADSQADASERRSRTGLIAAAVALLLVIGAGGWWWMGQQKDAPVKDAFTASHSNFSKASTQLGNAASIADIAAAGASFDSAVASLTATEEKTRTSDSDLSLAARRATTAEKAVAEAAAPLKALSSADLSTWAAAKEPLTQALTGLADVRDDVETAGGDASKLPTPEVVDSLQSVIADEIVNGAAATVTDLSAKLESASLLADVRAVGTSASEYVAPLREAAAGLDDEEKKSDLNAVVEFHEALSGLTEIRSATFDKWPTLRKDVEDAIGGLAANQDEARAGIAAADTLVKGAEKQFTEWETEHAAAKTKKAKDTSDLEAAIAAVEAADTTFATLRTQLDTIVKEVRGLPAEGREGDAFTKLDAAATAREDLLETLTGLTLTPNPAEKLQALVDIVESDAKAVRAAADAAAACTDECRLTDKPGWKNLGAGTKDSGTAWDEALPDWDSVAESTLEKIKGRELPKRPKI